MFDRTVSIQNQRPAIAFIAIILMIATYTFPLSPAFADETKAARIMVTGEGETSLAPDMAIVSLGVTREAETARDALTQNNDAMASVIASMKASGIEAKDLQTSNFSIQPRYFHHSPKNNEQPKPPSIIGYIVTNNLTLRLRDLTKLGEIIDKSVSLGVNADGGIRFINEDPGEAITKARISAMKMPATRRKRSLKLLAQVWVGWWKSPKPRTGRFLWQWPGAHDGRICNGAIRANRGRRKHLCRYGFGGPGKSLSSPLFSASENSFSLASACQVIIKLMRKGRACPGLFLILAILDRYCAAFSSGTDGHDVCRALPTQHCSEGFCGERP